MGVELGGRALMAKRSPVFFLRERKTRPKAPFAIGRITWKSTMLGTGARSAEPPAPEPPEPTSGEEVSDKGAGGGLAEPVLVLALASATAPSAASPSTAAAASTAAGSWAEPLAASSPASAGPTSAGLASRRCGVGVPCSDPCSDPCGVRASCCARDAASSLSATLFSSASLRTPPTMALPAKSSLRCSSTSTSCNPATTWRSGWGSG